MWIALMIVGLVLIVLVGRYLFRPDNSRSEKLMNQYRHLTPSLLEQTPENERIEAVVSNLLAKAEDARKDPYALIPTLSRERCAVYSLWLLQKELAGEDPSVLRRSGQFGFTELAADALDLLNFSDAATGVRDYLQSADPKTLETVRALAQDGTLNTALTALITDDPAAVCDPAPVQKEKIGD